MGINKLEQALRKREIYPISTVADQIRATYESIELLLRDPNFALNELSIEDKIDAAIRFELHPNLQVALERKYLN